MDNGQYANNLNDPFAEGITAGVGVSPEEENQLASDNLNTGNFQTQDPDNLNERGNSTLNAIGVQPDGFELTMPPTEQPTPPLGQVVDLMAPPQAPPATESEKTTPQNNEEDASIDSTIAHHLADGKVDKNDVGYLKSKTEDLVNDPAKLGEFVMKARRTITNRLSGDSK